MSILYSGDVLHLMMLRRQRRLSLVFTCAGHGSGGRTRLVFCLLFSRCNMRRPVLTARVRSVVCSRIESAWWLWLRQRRKHLHWSRTRRNGDMGRSRFIAKWACRFARVRNRSRIGDGAAGLLWRGHRHQPRHGARRTIIHLPVQHAGRSPARSTASASASALGDAGGSLGPARLRECRQKWPIPLASSWVAGLYGWGEPGGGPGARHG